MSFLNSVTDIFRPRTVAELSGPSGPGGVATAVASEPEPDDEEPVSERERRLMLHLSNASHAVNHFQNQMLTMLYPVIMADLGMSYMDVGVLTSIRSVVNTAAQASFGFVTPFVSRCKIMAFSNFGIAVGTLMSGLAMTYPMMVVARCATSLGSAAQHPVGNSILVAYYPKARGAILALNSSWSFVGTLIATPVATVLLLVMGWREIFYAVCFLSIIMGVIYLIFRDLGAPNRSGSSKARLRQGMGSYLRVLKNRNMMIIAAVFMVGAAGAEGGLQQTYFAPYLQNDLGYETVWVGVLLTAVNLGHIVGPIIFGRLSDKISRIGILQASLVFSALGTLWIANMGVGTVIVWFLGLFVYSSVTTSRGTLTQASIAVDVSVAEMDAAFSLYATLGFLAVPFWTLLTGYLMDNYGFSVAIERTTISYLIASALLFFLEKPKPAGVAA